MKDCLKIFSFLAGVGLLFLVFSFLYVGINQTSRKDKSLVGIVGEKENTIDYMVLGDSEAYMAINPLEIWGEYGYTGYVQGTPVQRLYQSKNYILEALETQKPKLIIMEANNLFRLQRTRDKLSILLKDVVPLFQYNDNWKFLFNSNQAFETNKNKGYSYNDDVSGATNTDYIHPTAEKKPIPQENIKIFESILEICAQNNMKLLLISTPSIESWSYEKHNSAVELANNYNLKYIDLNLEDIGIDWSTDTQDEGDHLNYSGALKVTKRLADYLNELNLLEDHRNDEEYKKWHTFYQEYQEKYKK